jgi:hypothetical protein
MGAGTSLPRTYKHAWTGGGIEEKKEEGMGHRAWDGVPHMEGRRTLSLYGTHGRDTIPRT